MLLHGIEVSECTHSIIRLGAPPFGGCHAQLFSHAIMWKEDGVDIRFSLAFAEMWQLLALLYVVFVGVLSLHSEHAIALGCVLCAVMFAWALCFPFGSCSIRSVDATCRFGILCSLLMCAYCRYLECLSIAGSQSHLTWIAWNIVLDVALLVLCACM